MVGELIQFDVFTEPLLPGWLPTAFWPTSAAEPEASTASTAMAATAAAFGVASCFGIHASRLDSGSPAGRTRRYSAKDSSAVPTTRISVSNCTTCGRMMRG